MTTESNKSFSILNWKFIAVLFAIMLLACTVSVSIFKFIVRSDARKKQKELDDLQAKLKETEDKLRIANKENLALKEKNANEATN